MTSKNSSSSSAYMSKWKDNYRQKDIQIDKKTRQERVCICLSRNKETIRASCGISFNPNHTITEVSPPVGQEKHSCLLRNMQMCVTVSVNHFFSYLSSRAQFPFPDFKSRSLRTLECSFLIANHKAVLSFYLHFFSLLVLNKTDT